MDPIEYAFILQGMRFSMQMMLVMFKADGTRRDFPCKGDKLVVGRKANCDLRIPLTSVSRQHCEISINGESAKVRDLGSSNGTFRNSERVQEAELAAGDQLVVGPVVFTVVLDGKPENVKPVRTILEAEAEESPSEPAAISDEELDLPGDIDSESQSPTVDLDDPIAALEAMASAEADNDDSDIALFLDDDD